MGIVFGVGISTILHNIMPLYQIAFLTVMVVLLVDFLR